MTVAWPQPGLDLASEQAHADIPLQAMVIGGSIPALVATAAWWLGVPYVAVIAAIGVPIGGVLSLVASGSLAGRGWLATSLLLGLGAPLIPGVCIAVVFAGAGLAAIASSGPEAAGGGVLFGVLALVVALVGGIPVTLPLALVAGFLVRRAATMAPERAHRHVASLAIVTGVLALPTLAIATTDAGGGIGLGPVDWALGRGEVPLAMTIENHTSRARTFDVSWDMGDGATNGFVLIVDGCSVVTDRAAARGGWTVTETDANGEPLAPPVAVAGDWPGEEPAITIVLAPGGGTSVRPGSLAVPDDDIALPRPATPCG